MVTMATEENSCLLNDVVQQSAEEKTCTDTQQTVSNTLEKGQSDLTVHKM